MQAHLTPAHYVAGHTADRRHRAFWLAVIVALIILLACTGPAAGLGRLLQAITEKL